MSTTTTTAEQDNGRGLPLSCQCGFITLTTPPRSLFKGMAQCHCTICQKQSGSAFGTSIYFPTSAVFPLNPDLESKLSVYKHNESESGNTIVCYFCPRCGVRVMHAGFLPGGDMREIMCYKGGLVDGMELDWKELSTKHIWTKSAVMPLAEEWECYEKYPPVKPGVEQKGQDEKKAV
ncbi:Mss4-like protein [Cladorrhinum sp. PSN259]|nr:Mss4-like protein [Cladorrhinum sp. PSN259]